MGCARILTFSKLLAMCWSCGGRSGALPRTSDGAGPPADSTASRPDGAMAPDHQLGPDLLPTRVEGLIYQTELRDQKSGAQQGAAYVFFTPEPMPFFKPDRALGGGCNLYPDEEVGDAQFSAGKVTFSGGPYSFSLSPEKPLKKNSWLYPGILFDDLFGQNTMVTVSAAGDDLAGFNGKVKGVGDLKVSFPPGNFIKRSSSFTLTFPKTDGVVWVTLQGIVSGVAAGNIRCSFSGSTGQVKVPAAALKGLSTGAVQVIVGAGLASETKVKPNSRLTVHLINSNIVRQTFYLQ